MLTSTDAAATPAATLDGEIEQLALIGAPEQENVTAEIKGPLVVATLIVNLADCPAVMFCDPVVGTREKSN